MTSDERTIQQLIDERFTHLQILCCAAKRIPLNQMPVGARGKTLEDISPHVVCATCGKRATPARIAPWHHGMQRL
jgi:hypothetical protein